MASTINRERNLFLARVEDMAQRARDRAVPCFLGFLDDHQRRLAEDGLKYSGLTVRFFGGYEDAERTMAGVSLLSELSDESFSIRCVQVTWRGEEGLTHRDVLGSLMGLNLKRETVGDIILEQTKAMVFVQAQVVPILLHELMKVGKTPVTCREIAPASVSTKRCFLEVTGTVSSLRVDCVTAFLANTSRGRADEMVAAGYVSVDGATEQRPDRQLSEGSKLSIRGVGKFIYDGQCGVSRKNKWKVLFRKYQ